MFSLKSLVLAGAAIAGVAVLAPAMARELNSHHLTIALPGGGVETIQYSGNVAPKVSFRPIAQAGDPFFAVSDFGLPTFTAMDQIVAQMDRQMNAMMQRAEMLQRLPQDDGLYRAVLHGLPQGATSFSMVSETSSNGVCTHVTRITQGASDAKPQVVSQTSGNCGQSHAAPASSNPDLMRANATMPAPAAPRSAL